MNLKYIFIVVILAAIVGGGILAWQYLLVPKEGIKVPEVKPPEMKAPEEAPPEEVLPEEVKAPEEVPADETADWQEFTDESFGYSIRYPNGWQYFDCSEAQYGGPCFLSDDYISAGGDLVDMIVSADQILAPMQGVLLTIVVDKAKPGEEIISCALVSPEEQEICEDIRVGGLPAAKLTIRNADQIPGGETLITISMVFVQEINFYLITVFYPECERRVNPDGSTFRDCSNTDEAPALFDQILSTLIFL